MTVVKGFYSDSLPDFQWNPGHKIALAQIDCDYYSSTVEVLNFIKDKMQHGTIIAFDDWNCFYADSKRGQRLAFGKWKEELINMFHFEPFLPISFGGMSFICQEKNKIGTEYL